MQAIILNSGMGKRMGDITKDIHKSMVLIKYDTPLIVHQIKTLLKCGIKDITITTGHNEQALRECLQNYFKDTVHFNFVFNDKYAETNYIYSMFLASEFVKDDLILFHGDLYFHETQINNLLKSKGNYVVVDTKIQKPEKDFKAKIQNGLVKKICVHLKDDDCYACQPLYKLSLDDAKLWFEKINEFCIEGNCNVYAEEALNTLLNKINLNPYDLRGECCMEVDNIDDLEKLKKILSEKEY